MMKCQKSMGSNPQYFKENVMTQESWPRQVVSHIYSKKERYSRSVMDSKAINSSSKQLLMITEIEK